MGISQKEFQVMVECMTADLVERLVQKKHYDFRNAVDTVYTSNTFAALQNAETGLYYQSPGYVMHYLIQEIETASR